MFALGLALWLISLLSVQPHSKSESYQSDQFAKGQIIEKVTCPGEPAQSYALYLPSNYSPERAWPVLYAFDPQARGKIPVERFKGAAEKYGWILVGSNNSRNGPMKVAFDASRAIWKDTHERLAIDERQTYFTGFSGGARVAVTLASACHDCVAGVILSGAGFPPEIKPSAATHFAVFGTTGLDDFNFPELKDLAETLAKAGVANQIEVFPGRHEWPPASLATEAIKWLILQAIKRKIRAPDDAFVAQVWQENLQRAKAAEEAKQVYNAYRIYESLARTFKELHDVGEIEKRLNELRATREVKQAISDERGESARQRELERQITELVYQRERNDDEFENGSRLSGLLATLQKSARVDQDSSDRRVARRVTEGQFIFFLEQGRELQNQKHYDDAIRKLRIATELGPERPGVFVMLASAYAMQGDKKKALQTLKTAVERGFTDRAAIISNSAFDSVRSDPVYVQLIEKLGQAPK